MSKMDLGKQLRDHGLRRTSGRMQILAVLAASRRPQTHAEILKRLKNPRINRVSVYRALKKLMEVGLVHRNVIRDRVWAFELSDRCGPIQCHPHFFCKKCGKVVCMTDVSVSLAANLPKGYVLERQKVSLEGLCAACNPRSSS